MNENLIYEGGAVGHLQHLYDNLELTFGELKDVLSRAASGKLEKVSEKLDGMNLVFTYDVSQDLLRVARNGGDIKSGGMNAAALAKKFQGRGNIEDAFNAAFKVLSDAMSAIPPTVKKKIFGTSGNRWYSIEIIYTANPNMINYDSNNIVFHGWPVFESRNGSTTQVDDDTGVQILSSRIDQMQKSLKLKGWKVRGPSLLSLKKMSDGSTLNDALSRIESSMANAGVSDNDNMFDYLRVVIGDEATSSLNIDEEAMTMVIDRCIGVPGAPGIPEIRKLVPKEELASVVEFIKASDALKRRAIQPIELAISDFAIEVLRGLKSTLISKSDAEVTRIQSQVSKAISAIESSGNQAAMDILQKEMSKLRSVDNVSSAMEGVVFFYKGQAYKFTGTFAPASQILSLFKYERKGVPKLDMGENILREVLNESLERWTVFDKDVL